jgi:site-specific DNA-methyltransferase (adenine-specific)
MSGRFQIIYADCPWQYRNRTIRGGAEHHYPTMSLEQICALRVQALAAENCALFLWATWPTLMKEARLVIEAWGFTYKTCAFDWVKITKSGKPATGLGHYTRGNSEPCLLATRGRPHRVDAGVSQIVLDETLIQEAVFAERGEHSAKPPEVRDRIVRLMGDVPRIELFARERVHGWHAWGNELPTLQRTA